MRGAAKSLTGAAGSPAILELPGPNGGIQRFRVHESPIMEPGLAARHPEIKTYAGRGLEDATATVRADLGPRGLHASVRSAAGGWYVDPYYRNDDSVYVSYFTRDAHENAAEQIAQSEPIGEGVDLNSAAAAELGRRSSCAPTAWR